MQTNRLKLLSKHIELYREETEQWQEDHDAAMLCFDVERSVATYGLHIYQLLCQQDEYVHSLVFNHPEISPEETNRLSEALHSLYESWYAVSQELLKHVDWCEQHGFTIENANKLREAAKEVAGVLKQDKEFFQGPALEKLEAEALREHSLKNTVEIQEFSD